MLGQWTISIEEPGKEDITGTFNYRAVPHQTLLRRSGLQMTTIRQ